MLKLTTISIQNLNKITGRILTHGLSDFSKFLSFMTFVLCSVQFAVAQNAEVGQQQDQDSITSEYIIDHKTQFNVKLEVGNEISTFNVIENDVEANLRPNLNLRYGLVFSYKFLSVRIGIRPKISANEKEEKGDTDSFRLRLQLLFDNWNHLIQYNRYKGYYIDNSSRFVDVENGYIQLPDLTSNLISGSSVYKFNKDYSIRAIQSQTEIQSKRAGSLIAGLAYNFYSLDGAERIKNLEPGEITIREYYNEYRGVNLSLQAGYYYTMVFNTNWFINAYGIPAAGIDFYKVNFNSPAGSEDRRYNDFFLSLNYGVGGGYNGKRIFFGAKYNNRFSNEKFSSNRFHIIPSKNEFSVYFGYRFKAPKTISKPVEYIEDKVPILKDEPN